jgi:hypothetical protein
MKDKVLIEDIKYRVQTKIEELFVEIAREFDFDFGDIDVLDNENLLMAEEQLVNVILNYLIMNEEKEYQNE